MGKGTSVEKKRDFVTEVIEMAEHIDRDAFLEQQRAWYCNDCDRRKNTKGKAVYEIGEAPCRACDIGTMLDSVEDYPAADVVERKTGKWLEVELLHLSDDPEELEVTSVASMRCSVCKRYHNEAHLYGSDLTEDVNYCPYCGAKMGGNENV